MGWKPVERFVEGKLAGRICEDMIVTTSDFGAVIDGASDATGAVYAGLSGGRFAAEAIAETIGGLDRSCTARMFAVALSTTLSDRVASDIGQLAADMRWPAATVVCLSFARDEIWRVGDCSFLVDGVENLGTIRIGEVKRAFRAALNAALIRAGMQPDAILNHDPGAQAIRALTDVQQHLSNEIGPWGYGCINGRSVPDPFLEIYPLEQNVMQVVLASDGYPRLRPTLEQTEEELQDMLKADPAGLDQSSTAGRVRMPSAKSYDDRSYLRFRRDG